MVSDRFSARLVLRVALLAVTLLAWAWSAANTEWYATLGILSVLVVLQLVALLRAVSTTNREIARFLDAVEFDDLTRTFTGHEDGGSFVDLRRALNRVMERLRATRSEREEQAHFERTLVEHVPVALISIRDDGTLRLLNSAARRLFGVHHPKTVDELAQLGSVFAQSIKNLAPGVQALIKMEQGPSSVQLKAAATQVLLGGIPQKLVSLQSIESELNAQELAAWQALIRVLTHEIMNSLTPVSSLSRTALGLVAHALEHQDEHVKVTETLKDAHEALDAVARRSEGLLHFVQSYRRFTQNLVPKTERFPVRRIFSRLERLMGPDLSSRNIEFSSVVEPETLELSADSELLDQALINLLRNATDALKGQSNAKITFAARLEDSRVALSVADNGPGVPSDIREQIFVPFFTTKRQGTGVGLSLTRQIALVHGASLDVSDTPGGGATFTMRFT